MNERQLQRQIVEGLQWLGYIVLEIGKARAKVRCQHCNALFYPKGWQGNTTGAPDLFITRADWNNRWIAVELKTNARKLQPEQKAFAELGASAICYSLEDVLHVLNAQTNKFMI